MSLPTQLFNVGTYEVVEPWPKNINKKKKGKETGNIW